MKKILLWGGALIICAGGAWLVWFWVAPFQSVLQPGEIVGVPGGSDVGASVSYEITEFATGLNVPWSMVFTSPDRMLVSERPGRIRIIESGVLSPRPLHIFTEVSTGGEEGLMSLAVSPEYATTKHIYASLAYSVAGTMYVKVVRFVDSGTALTDETVIIDKIPGAQYHAGSRIKFGPDGKLYITTGDATDRALAQQMDSLAGKILRLNPDGTIPTDNPYPDSPIWSLGHRNPQGIAWNLQGEMYSTEHGPSVFDGPTGGDELNHIVKGGNYGWPLVSHEEKKEGTVSPLLVFTPSEAPASLLVYSGTALPQFRDHMFFGALVGSGLIRVALEKEDSDKIDSYEKLSDVQYGRIRDVAEGPDGSLYFSTSNRDGRGDPALNDDRIFRIAPRE